MLAGHLQAGLRATQGELVIGPGQAHVQGHFASVRAGARTALLGALDSQRYFSLLDELDKLMAEAAIDPTGSDAGCRRPPGCGAAPLPAGTPAHAPCAAGVTRPGQGRGPASGAQSG